MSLLVRLLDWKVKPSQLRPESRIGTFLERLPRIRKRGRATPVDRLSDFFELFCEEIQAARPLSAAGLRKVHLGELRDVAPANADRRISRQEPVRPLPPFQ